MYGIVDAEAIERQGIVRCWQAEKSTGIQPIDLANFPIAKATSTVIMTTTTTMMNMMKRMITIRKNLKEMGSMYSWPEARIGEHCDVKGGKRLPKGEALRGVLTSYPYIRVVDMQHGHIEQANLQYVPDDVYPRIKRYTVASGNIMISIMGTIGSVAIIPQELNGANLTENAAKIMPVSDDVDVRFLYYYLRSREGQAAIGSQTVGSTQPKLALYRIKDIPFPKPPFVIQQRIARILGTMDDKIELNHRMNETLEAMARTLFKSWFVDFDPVRAKAEGRDTGLPDEIADLFPDSFEDSELGEIPKGWKLEPFSEIVEINPPRTLTKEAVAPYVDMAALPTSGSQLEASPTAREYKPGSRCRNGDVLFARITPCLDNGKTVLVDFLEDGEVEAGSTEFLVFGPRVAGTYFTYCASRWDALRDHAITSMTGTSGRQRAQKEAFDHLEMAIPDSGLLSAFEARVAPVFVAQRNASTESRSLSAIRDTLLPHLVSGEIDVSLEGSG